MRWKDRYVQPFLGHKRVIERFLLFPRSIENEYRWLEKAKILQEYSYTGGLGSAQYIDKEWIDDN